jgi:hypothetical protein
LPCKLVAAVRVVATEEHVVAEAVLVKIVQREAEAGLVAERTADCGP